MKYEEIVKELLKIVYQKVKSNSCGTLPDLCDLQYASNDADRFIQELKEHTAYKELMDRLKSNIDYELRYLTLRRKYCKIVKYLDVVRNNIPKLKNESDIYIIKYLLNVAQSEGYP